MGATTPDNIMQLGMGFWASKALLSVVELGVFTELAAGPADLPDLQTRLKLHPRSARDFLDTQVALKLPNARTAAIAMPLISGRYEPSAMGQGFAHLGKLR